MVTTTPNPYLIAFVGDLHGKLAAFEHTAAQALNRGVCTIVQVGDFWIYDRSNELTKLQRVLRRICPDGIELGQVDYRFIDGNHENFDVLTPNAAGPVTMSDNATYMPRGTRATLSGADLLFVGGASSTDLDHRTEGVSWWPDENITGAQSARAQDAAQQGPVDVMVTHETTSHAFNELCDRGGHALDKLGDPAGETNRAHLDRIVEAARPRVHVHGHHHTWHVSTHDGVVDIALSLEKARGSVAIVDTSDWTWRVPIGRQDTGADDTVEIESTQP